MEEDERMCRMGVGGVSLTSSRILFTVSPFCRNRRNEHKVIFPLVFLCKTTIVGRLLRVYKNIFLKRCLNKEKMCHKLQNAEERNILIAVQDKLTLFSEYQPVSATRLSQLQQPLKGLIQTCCQKVSSEIQSQEVSSENVLHICLQ